MVDDLDGPGVVRQRNADVPAVVAHGAQRRAAAVAAPLEPHVEGAGVEVLELAGLDGLVLGRVHGLGHGGGRGHEDEGRGGGGEDGVQEHVGRIWTRKLGKAGLGLMPGARR